MTYGPLPELQNEVENATSYRTELEAYINLHSISFSAANGGNRLNISNLDISDLEISVESHMQFCKSDYNMDERIRSQQIRGNLIRRDNYQTPSVLDFDTVIYFVVVNIYPVFIHPDKSNPLEWCCGMGSRQNTSQDAGFHYRG